ncbi:MAG: hypothetical protein CMF23_11165 [Ignavibacteriae bacterium]|nr:hypothetical protein [Ignavibacteriota bacterium]
MISSLPITALSLLHHCKYWKNEVKTNKVMKVTKISLFDEKKENNKMNNRNKYMYRIIKYIKEYA